MKTYIQKHNTSTDKTGWKTNNYFQIILKQNHKKIGQQSYLNNKSAMTFLN